jgi:hypothetical protein
MQSEGVAHTCSVSVTVCVGLPQENWTFEMHVATHCEVSVAIEQFGSVPPLKTAVPQHSGVTPVH